MIYLTTGANGAGKTLLMLADVRKQQLATNRPVFYNGFQAGEKLTREFGWKPFDPQKWQELPDGSICVMDECQNEFPLRKSSADVPGYVNAVAQFRRSRGFDFWMTCPHPMLLDVFIRRLIDNPSWHRHIKRTAGAHLVSVLKWNAVNTNCEKPGSGASGEVTMVPYPKEVFEWYNSASLHTGKTKIPRAVYVLGACCVLVPVMGYFAAQRIMKPAPSLQAQVDALQAAKSAGGAPPSAVTPLRAPGAGSGASLSPGEYVASHAPRVGGLAFTAPRYDALTVPVDAPYPAACIEGVSPRTKKAGCDCFTQQGTRLTVPESLCRQIVAQGFFVDWQKTAVVATPVAVAPGAPVALAATPDTASYAPVATAAALLAQPSLQVEPARGAQAAVDADLRAAIQPRSRPMQVLR
jgi:zona occludens toxin